MTADRSKRCWRGIGALTALLLSTSPVLADRAVPAPAEFLARTAELVEAHRLMQAARYVPDPPGTDVWRASWEGDCEDIALAALEWLVERGWPRESMRIAVGRVEAGPYAGQAHAILCVLLPGQLYSDRTCLDALRDAPAPLSTFGRGWVLR